MSCGSVQRSTRFLSGIRLPFEWNDDFYEDVSNFEQLNIREMRGMAFDFKKEYKEFYMPKNKPGIITVPSMNYIAVRGSGDPNMEDGEYKQSMDYFTESLIP